jgi:hypothetical protein
LRVTYAKKQVKSGPPIGTDGDLAASAEGAVFAHYEMPYQAAPNERRLARR